MLKLRNVCKYYKIGKVKKTILDNISLDFGDKGLVLILGASGSGKSTLLSIIGGNLKCDAGEVWFNNLCISKFNDKKMDSYRRMIVGTIFQDYNLIDYMDVWDNVVLGSSREVTNNDIIKILKQLDIYDKRYVNVNRLSGGERQRVAIARTLIYNPFVILADEPTGALDSTNSILIMEILKKIAQEKLVILVSHDVELANAYADRIINLKDGKCNYQEVCGNTLNEIVLKKTKASYCKIIGLALKKLWLKKTRTLITSIAIAMGMIGMFTVINLYNNFSAQIKNLEKRVVSLFPIQIKNGDFELLDYDDEKDDKKIIFKRKEKYFHTNRINEKYINYLKNIKEIQYMTFDYDVSMPIISDKYQLMNNKYFKQIVDGEYIKKNFSLLAGNNINNRMEILLKVDQNNNVSGELLEYFNINGNISYDDIIGRKVKVMVNDDYYIKNGEYYVPRVDYQKLYNESGIELTIVGVVREIEETNNDTFFFYDSTLMDLILDINNNSDIVLSQIALDYNVLGLNVEKNDMLSYLGYNTVPIGVNLYFLDIDSKNKVINYLDDYNSNNEKLIYIDMMSETILLIKQFMMIMGVILVSFSIIAIVIALLMVGILTNVRVLESKREIGILRCLGFSRKSVCKLFNTENLGLGIIAILISILGINLMVEPLNNVINRFIDGGNVFRINYVVLFLVSIFSLFIVRLSGLIPAKRAGKLEIIDCIYNR